MTCYLQECSRAIARYTNSNHLRSLTGQSDLSFIQAHPCRRVCPEPAKPRKLPEVTRPFSLLRVGFGDETSVWSAHENFMITPTLCQTTPIFAWSRLLLRVSRWKNELKLSGIDLAAIEAHLLIIRPDKITILGRRAKWVLPPFLEYWGSYSPPVLTPVI